MRGPADGATKPQRSRNELARHWAESVVDEVAATHALLLRESLESQLGA